jgi:hypothetical protein
VLASDDRALAPALAAAGFTVRRVTFTPPDLEAASKIEHFETYNRTPASQRVADIARALLQSPRAMLVADGDAGPAAVLALALAPVERAVIDVGRFDTSSDVAYLDRLYVPGIRRADDLQTAVSMATGRVLIHNAGAAFDVRGIACAPSRGRAAASACVTVMPRPLGVREVVRKLREPRLFP